MRKPSPSMIVALVALFVALSGVGVAANGGNFILGHANNATLNTSLSAPVVGGKALQVTNNNTSNAASTALGLNVASGHAPFTVNSGVKVASLNADMVDGLDSSLLQRRVSGNCSGDTALQAIGSNGTVTCSSTLQQRVAGTCASGSAVSGVNTNGSVTCQTVTSVYHVSVNQFGVAGIGASPEFVKVTHLGTGKWDVFFTVSINSCQRVATLGVPSGTRDNSAFQSPVGGEVFTDAELVDQDTGAIISNAVTVATFNSAGTLTDRAFHLIVV
jgi:hypothetical protein